MSIGVCRQPRRVRYVPVPSIFVHNFCATKFNDSSRDISRVEKQKKNVTCHRRRHHNRVARRARRPLNSVHMRKRKKRIKSQCCRRGHILSNFTAVSLSPNRPPPFRIDVVACEFACVNNFLGISWHRRSSEYYTDTDTHSRNNEYETMPETTCAFVQSHYEQQ